MTVWYQHLIKTRCNNKNYRRITGSVFTSEVGSPRITRSFYISHRWNILKSILITETKISLKTTRLYNCVLSSSDTNCCKLKHWNTNRQVLKIGDHSSSDSTETGRITRKTWRNSKGLKICLTTCLKLVVVFLYVVPKSRQIKIHDREKTCI